jgi:hypothetical protein
MKPDTEQIIEALRAGAWAAEIKLMDIAADRLEELQRLNDSMQVDRDLWMKVERKKLQTAEKERDQLHAEVARVKACCEQGDKMLQRSKQDLTRIRSERDAAVDAGIKLCVHGQPQENQAEEWRAAARVISVMHAND